MALDGFAKPNKAARLEDLPPMVTCLQCATPKPLSEMLVVRIKREGIYRVRPRCKECHNARERGHRREYKKLYLRRWRRENPKVNEAYWKGDPVKREQARVAAARRLTDPNYRDALAIQRRLRTKGIKVPLDEAKELLQKYGRCYPTRFGLTKAGLRECERIRSRLRSHVIKNDRRMTNSFDIRIMVYEQSEDERGLVIPPHEQPVPYESAGERLRQRWQLRKEIGS